MALPGPSGTFFIANDSLWIEVFTFAENNDGLKYFTVEHLSIESIYREIVLLSDIERDKLYNRIKKDFYPNSEIVAYTTDGQALTREEYKKRVNTGIEQCMRGESTSLEELSEELGYNYADL
ncbi:MAG: hypothetical protein LBK12_07920 [Odoribacteraceae bacterium]|jgi:hypothetical protein|nr:hypothetical protein [Odoribacteraceae bacterium]